MTLTIAGEPLLAYLLASIRIVAWLVLVPPFSSRAVPVGAKVVLALALAFAVAPAMAEAGMPTGGAAIVVAALTQVTVGAALGFVTFLLLGAISAAGSLIDVFGGFALARAFDPLGMSMNTIFGQFHQLLGTMLLFASGGHLIVVGGLLKTFEALPLGDTPSYGGPETVITAFGMFFLIALQIAMPMVAVLFVADLGLALLTKVAPQLNALNVMFPAKIGLTLLLLGLSFPVLPEVTRNLVELVNEAAAAVVGGG